MLNLFLPSSICFPGGGYSLCDGWYICAAVLTPFFHFGRIEHDLFGVLFLIHQQQSYLLGYKNYQFLQKSIFLAPNSFFSSIFLGPIFSGQRHTPISFQAEYTPPPPPPPPGFAFHGYKPFNLLEPRPGHALLNKLCQNHGWWCPSPFFVKQATDMILCIGLGIGL